MLTILPQWNWTWIRVEKEYRIIEIPIQSKECFQEVLKVIQEIENKDNYILYINHPNKTISYFCRTALKEFYKK